MIEKFSLSIYFYHLSRLLDSLGQLSNLSIIELISFIIVLDGYDDRVCLITVSSFSLKITFIESISALFSAWVRTVLYVFVVEPFLDSLIFLVFVFSSSWSYVAKFFDFFGFSDSSVILLELFLLLLLELLIEYYVFLIILGYFC